MKTNETNNTARTLTLEEIESLPLTSVIWMSWYMKTDQGIIWHETVPVMVAVPGKDGLLIGGDKDDVWDRDINENLFSDPENSYWNHQPTDDQLPGITREEYDATPDYIESIAFPELATAITSRKLTFNRFAEMIGMPPTEFWAAFTGKTEFSYDEIMKIKTVLNLDNAHINRYFFTPKEIAEKVYTMTCAEFLLFEKITNLCIGRPDRQRYALNYTGEITDLPAALAQI